MGSKRRTDLKNLPPTAKILEEFDFDVKTGLAPPKSAANYEKLIFASRQFSEHFFCDVEKSKVANLPKPVMKKFRTDQS